MPSRNDLRRRLKAASKRRNRRQSADSDSGSPSSLSEPTRTRVVPLDAVLETVLQWAQASPGAVDQDLAGAVREILTGRSASGDTAAKLVSRLRLLSESSDWSERQFRGAVTELSEMAKQHRGTGDPTSLLAYIEAVSH